MISWICDNVTFLSKPQYRPQYSVGTIESCPSQVNVKFCWFLMDILSPNILVIVQFSSWLGGRSPYQSA